MTRFTSGWIDGSNLLRVFGFDHQFLYLARSVKSTPSLSPLKWKRPSLPVMYDLTLRFAVFSNCTATRGSVLPRASVTTPDTSRSLYCALQGDRIDRAIAQMMITRLNTMILSREGAMPRARNDTLTAWPSANQAAAFPVSAAFSDFCATMRSIPSSRLAVTLSTLIGFGKSTRRNRVFAPNSQKCTSASFSSFL